jgi:hypothetical protein
MQENKVCILSNNVSSIMWIIETLLLRGVWILRFPRHVKYSPMHVEPYRGKAPNNMQTKMDVSGHVLVSRYIHITDMFYGTE